MTPAAPITAPPTTSTTDIQPTSTAWAFSASGQLNLPGDDIVGINFVWAKGATGYVSNSNWWQLYANSNSRAMGWATDGIFSTGTDVELTEAWSINAAYQHVWGPSGTFGGKWRTSVYGGSRSSVTTTTPPA